MKKILSFILVVCLLFGLIGCNKNDTKDETISSDITLIQLLSQRKEHNNYKQITTQKVTLSISSKLDISVDTIMNTYVYDLEHVKTETITTSSLFSNSSKTVSYIDGDNIYLTKLEDLKLPEVIQTTKEEIGFIDIDKLTDYNIFENAEIRLDPNSDLYIVTVKMSDLLNRIDLKDLFSIEEEVDEEVYPAIVEEFSKVNIIYKYDKYYNLKYITIDNINYTVENSPIGNLCLNIYFEMEFLDYDNVTIEDIEIPNYVLN